jgi:DNA repair exonuclease SbcCD nuclease subunit
VFNIGLLHTNANGNCEHGTYAPCTVAELAAKGYDYWALGHVHSFEVLHTAPHVVYSGNTQGRHIREAGCKGCAVVTVADDGQARVELAATDVLRWFPVTVTLAPEDGLDELYDLARLQLQQAQRAADGRLAAVRLEVEGRCAAHRQLARQAAAQQAAAHLRSLAGEFADDLWVEKIKFRTQPPLDLDRLRQGHDLVGDLLRSIAALDRDEAALTSLAALLKPLAGKAGPELAAEGLDLESPAPLRSWLRQAEAVLLGHLTEERA